MDKFSRIISSLFHRNRQLILYGVIGCISASIDFFVFTLLVNCLAVHYLLANVLSVCVGIMISFISNRHFNFKVKDKTLQRFVIFAAVGVLGMILSSSLLTLFIEVFYMNIPISKILSIVIVVGFQFIANKYITFRKTK